MKTTIYLIRHAQAEGNLCRRMHGQYNSNLTSLGLRQAAALGQRFAELPLDACYASDLTRAKNTADAVCQVRGLPMQVEKDFREVAVGVWEDRSFGFLRYHYGEKLQQFVTNQKSWQIDGGESYEEYTGRFRMALDRVVSAHLGETIAVVTHSIVMKAVLRQLFPEVEFSHSRNTAVTKLHWENGAYFLDAQNDSSHLTEALAAEPQRGNETIWFRQKDVLSYEVMDGAVCLGTMKLQTQGSCGIWSNPEQIRAWKGVGLPALGKAVCVFRRLGLTEFCWKPETPEEVLLCQKLPFEDKGRGVWSLGLTPQVRAVIGLPSCQCRNCAF